MSPETSVVVIVELYIIDTFIESRHHRVILASYPLEGGNGQGEMLHCEHP